MFVSDSGEQALLVTGEFEVHLWELRDGLHSEWWKVPAPDDICLPHTSSRDTAVDATFHVHQVNLQSSRNASYICDYMQFKEHEHEYMCIRNRFSI